MNDDELDRLLTERGDRWRAAQPAPPALDTRWPTRRLPPWVVPVAVAAAVIAVVAGSGVLLTGDGIRHRDPSDTATSSTGSSDPLSGVVPWEYADPRHPKFPKPTEVFVPDPAYADGLPGCTAAQLAASSQVEGAAGTMYLNVLLTARPGVRCALSGRVGATLYDGAAPLDVPTEQAPAVDGMWTFPVVVDAANNATIALSWSSMWCVDPVRNDRVMLTFDGGEIAVEGFGQSPACNNPGSDQAAAVRVGRFAPEHWELTEGARPLEPLAARQVDFLPGVDGGPATFVVELVATERDLVLAPCPDATVVQRHSFDDQSEVRYGLNCAAVPHQNADGVPYLSQGEPVRFAVQAQLSETPAESYNWLLEATRPVAKLELDLPD